MTARPLAAFTLAPSAPAIVSSATSSQNEPAQPAAATSTPHPARPLASTIRSPIRSESSPQGRSVAIGPIHTLEKATPTALSDRSYRSCSAGPRTGSPIRTAENPA